MLPARSRFRVAQLSSRPANLAPPPGSIQSNLRLRVRASGWAPSGAPAIGEPLPMTPLPPEAVAIIEGRHADPFSYLGLHVDAGSAVLRVFLPEAQEASALWDDGGSTALDRIHPAGLFLGPRPEGARRYRLRAR